MAPDQEAQDGYGYAREADDLISENTLARKTGHDLADHAHGGENHDVHGGVGMEPKQVLEEQGIAAESGGEDAHLKHALEKQEKKGDRQDGSAQHENDAGGIHGPEEEGHAEPSHAGGAHFVDGDDEIQAGEDGGKSGDENAERGGDNLRIGVGAAVGSVERPAGVHAAVNHRIHGERSEE